MGDHKAGGPVGNYRCPHCRAGAYTKRRNPGSDFDRMLIVTVTHSTDCPMIPKKKAMGLL